MKVIGIEAANSFVKSKSAKGEIVYLNTVREHSNKEETLLQVAKSSDMFKYDGRSYTVGSVNDYLSSSARDEDKYRSSQYKLENLLGIAHHVENGDELLVVTGVPSAHYSDDIAKQVREQLLGTHTVYVNKEPRTFEIKKVNVMLQPIGTIMSVLLKEDGEYRNGALDMISTGRTSVVVDIGWGTTDVAIMDGADLTDYFGLGTSMLDAYEGILDAFDLRSKMTPFKAEAQLRAGDNLSYGGIDYNAADKQVEIFERTAQTIVSKLKNRLQLETYDNVIFTGGGVTALLDHLTEAALDIPNAIKIKDPQLANTRGYYALGQAAVNRL